MPYNAETGAGVPDHVVGDKARRQWANVWNGTFKETGSEERAFAAANSVYNRRKKHKKLLKFGTALTGFTEGFYGPFQCGHCTAFADLGENSICRMPEVQDDSAVPEDEYGNKVVDGDDCCNFYNPINAEMEKFMALSAAKSGTFDEVMIFCPLVKVDEAKREVWGVVTAEVPDRDDEICDYETTVPHYKALVDEMKKASEVNPDGGVNIFPLRAMHGLIAAGKGIAIEFRKEAKEIYMGFKVVDDNEWNKVQQNVYTGFSQGGRYLKRWKDGDNIRYTAKPGEVSLVDVPCLQRAHFDYVKADGSVEMRKYYKAAELPSTPGVIPTTLTPVEDVKKEDLEEAREGSVPPSEVEGDCTCMCNACKGGNHAECMAGEKCAAAKAFESLDLTKKEKKKPGVKYLVTDSGGHGYLPYTRGDGKPNHNLMGAAWAALFSPGGHRGNKYEGPNKEQAKSKLKGIYRREKMETPAEKALKAQKDREDKIQKRIEGMLVDVINNRAFGRLNKGMYGISRFSQIIEDLKYLWLSFEYEEEQEGDESPATDGVMDCYMQLLDHLVAYTEEQVEEAKQETMRFEAVEHSSI